MVIKTKSLRAQGHVPQLVLDGSLGLIHSPREAKMPLDWTPGQPFDVLVDHSDGRWGRSRVHILLLVLVTLALGLLGEVFAAAAQQTFSGSCQAICF